MNEEKVFCVINGVTITYDWVRKELEKLETPRETHLREFGEACERLKMKFKNEEWESTRKLIDIGAEGVCEWCNEENLMCEAYEDEIEGIKMFSSESNQVEQREIKLLMDTKGYTSKPSKDRVEQTYVDTDGTKKKLYETAMVSIRLTKNQISTNIIELIKAVENGKAFTVAAFKPGSDNKIHRTKECWESQDLLALDFDNGITPDEFLERSMILKLMPAFIYSSFSDSIECRKFRAVYVLKERLYDYRDANTCTLALMELFKECDKACKDLNRMYYGGKSIIYQDQSSRVDPYQIMDAYCYDVFINNNSSNYKRAIRRFCSKVALNLENGLPKKAVAKSASSISIYRGGDICDQCYFDYAVSEDVVAANCVVNNECLSNKVRYCVTNSESKRELMRNINLYEGQCMLWRLFLDGELYPFDDEFMHLCLNMLCIEGGEKAIKLAINEMPHASTEVKELYKSKIRYFKSRYNKPSRCLEYCPKFKEIRERVEIDGMGLKNMLVEKCKNNGKNIIDSFDNKKGSIRLLKEIESVSLDEAREEFGDLFQEILSNEDYETIHVIRGGSGLGKTEILKYISNYSNTVIAYPNHNLGKEISGRLSIPNALYMKDIDISDESVLGQYKYFLQIGYYKESYRVLEQYMNKLKAEYENKEDINIKDEIESIQQYINNLKEISITDRPILCTHSRLMHLNNKNIKTYIIDEDILPTICESIDLDLNKLMIIEQMALSVGATTIISSIRTLKSYVKQSIENTSVVVKVPTLHYDRSEVKKVIESNYRSLTDNILNVLSVRFIKCDDKGKVLGIIKNKLPEGKVIIMSATANEVVYKNIFKERRLVFHNMSHIQSKGKLLLHYGGYSRNYFNKNIDKVITTVKKEVKGINNVITFKKYKHHFEKAGFEVIATYGACSGIDAYRGQDLIVVGTPHCNDAYYKLMAALINEDVQIVSSAEYQNVQRNGFEFFINTYNAGTENSESEILREIQYYFIESELVQAIGRSRIVSNNATVHYFASYPIIGSELVS